MDWLLNICINWDRVLVFLLICIISLLIILKGLSSFSKFIYNSKWYKTMYRKFSFLYIGTLLWLVMFEIRSDFFFIVRNLSFFLFYFSPILISLCLLINEIMSIFYFIQLFIIYHLIVVVYCYYLLDLQVFLRISQKTCVYSQKFREYIFKYVLISKPYYNQIWGRNEFLKSLVVLVFSPYIIFAIRMVLLIKLWTLNILLYLLCNKVKVKYSWTEFQTIFLTLVNITSRVKQFLEKKFLRISLTLVISFLIFQILIKYQVVNVNPNIVYCCVVIISVYTVSKLVVHISLLFIFSKQKFVKIKAPSAKDWIEIIYLYFSEGIILDIQSLYVSDMLTNSVACTADKIQKLSPDTYISKARLWDLVLSEFEKHK